MPFEHDPITQIINVHWGGEAAFVAADGSGNIYYTEAGATELADNGTDEAFLVIKPFPENTYHCASSATINGQTVFVLVGEYSGRNDLDQYEGGSGAVIIASRDGKTWTKVLDKPWEFIGDRGPPIVPGSEFVTRLFHSVVYDRDATSEGGGMFYAAAYMSRIKWAVAGSMEGDILYSSHDGFTWVEGAENLHEYPLTPHYPSVIAPHCTKPQNRGQVPDGLQGYDSGSEIFVGPVGVHVEYTSIVYDTFPPPSEVNIQGAEDPHKDVSMPCYAVAFGGPAWIAVGGTRPVSVGGKFTAVADVALDGTGPWRQIFNESDKGPIVTITAIARTDSA